MAQGVCQPPEKKSHLIFEKDRLETFSKNWIELGYKKCTPKNFASAGFYNINTEPTSDTVKCFSCQLQLGDWEESDDPWEEHLKRGDNCPFVKYKTQKETTIKDFLDLHYETKRNELKSFFKAQRQALEEQKEVLLKKAANLKKKNKSRNRK